MSGFVLKREKEFLRYHDETEFINNIGKVRQNMQKAFYECALLNKM